MVLETDERQKAGVFSQIWDPDLNICAYIYTYVCIYICAYIYTHDMKTQTIWRRKGISGR